ncbi:ABC transporter permease subunit [Pseudogracilibacillus sp. SE30717A]|uniref:ABC transporter permease n=1 Tax=Pseudogracilibacillus sp. SE30717A TaxID=3098293 RepID=UPI00300E05C0
MQWITMFKKEVLESWRNKKWIWVPIVMMLLTMMDPISYYYLPEIINLAGGVPEGTIIEIPSLAPTEVVMMSLEQLSLFGVFIIVLTSMSTIAGERQNGTTEIILVKPIKHHNYVTAKWTAFLLLIWFGLFLGMLINWYYTNLLFGDLSFLTMVKIVMFYGLWFTLVLTISIFFNTLFKVPGLVAACTVITLLILSVINMIFGHKLTLFPNQLSTYIYQMIETNSISNQLVGTSVIILFLCGILLFLSIYLFKNKEVMN